MTAALSFDLGGTNLRAALAEAGREGDAAALGHWPAPPDLARFQTPGRRPYRGAPRIARSALRFPASRPELTAPGFPNLPYLDGQDLSGLFPGVTVALGNDAHFALLAEVGPRRGARRRGRRSSSRSARASVPRFWRTAGSCAGTAARRRRSAGPAPIRWTSATASMDGSSAMQRDPPWTRSPGAPDSPMDAQLIAAARAGDPVAREGLEKPCAALGAAIAGAIAMLGSRSVIVSGGLAESVDVLGPHNSPHAQTPSAAAPARGHARAGAFRRALKPRRAQASPRSAIRCGQGLTRESADPYRAPRPRPARAPVASDRTALRALIADGTWPDGAQLPNEAKLSEMLGVSRITIRHALRNMEEWGLLAARAGTRHVRAQFDRHRRRARTDQPYAGNGRPRALRRLAHSGAERRSPPTTRSRRRSKSARGPVVKLRRLRFGGGQPIGIQTAYLPAKRATGLAEHERSARLALCDAA